MKKKHLLVVSQYFYPEQFRINDICEEWIKRGYQITVLSGIPNYPKGRFYSGYGFLKKRHEKYKGIDIVRIPIIPRGNNSLMLMLNYLSFVISGFFWAIFTNLKADFVFIYEVSPMSQALPGVWYAKKKKIPCYLYVMDLWPDNVIYVTGLKNKFIISAINRMVNYVYKGSDIIFTSSQQFAKIIRLQGVAASKIRFWPQYAEEYYKPTNGSECDGISQDGIVNFIFAGNIGFAQGLEILPEVAAILKSNNYKIRFNIVGEGRAKENLQFLVEDKGVNEYFNFIEKQPAQRISELVGACDISLICLSKSKVFESTLPAKLQSCLACGKPILVSADGEIQEIIKDANAGICSEAGNASMLADKIVELLKMDAVERAKMSRNAIEYSNSHFNKDMLLDEMDQYFLL